MRKDATRRLHIRNFPYCGLRSRLDRRDTAVAARYHAHTGDRRRDRLGNSEAGTETSGKTKTATAAAAAPAPTAETASGGKTRRGTGT